MSNLFCILLKHYQLTIYTSYKLNQLEMKLDRNTLKVIHSILSMALNNNNNASNERRPKKQ